MFGTVRLQPAPVLQRKIPVAVPNHSDPSGVRAIDLTAVPLRAENAGSSATLFPSADATPSFVVPIKSLSSPSAKRLRTSRPLPAVLDQLRLTRPPSMRSTPRP